MEDRGFNLISTPWLPALRESGRRETIRPSDLTLGIDDDPIVEIDWPRADFRCATLEFLVGLITVACPPESNRDWLRRWTKPPSPAELEAAFAPLARAFFLDGDGPRAFQDFEELADLNLVGDMLMSAPGAGGVRKADVNLVGAERVEAFSRRGAAIALLTLQTMAPEGGRGHRTSLRGGGPLTTLILPTARKSLWHRVWANTPTDAPAEPEQRPLIFPWLAPTRTSGKDGGTTAPGKHADWRQCFFGMPRRIRLDFIANAEGVRCDLTGAVDAIVVRTYRTRPYGVKYDAWGGRHPLTPHRRKPTDPNFYPVHGQSGRMGYLQWVAVLYGDQEETRFPARCVTEFVTGRNGDLPFEERDYRLTAAGYAMKQMKALSFIEAETPEITPPEGDGDSVAANARKFVAAASLAAGTLSYAVKIALYGEGAEVKSDSTTLATARDRFWADTNDRFFVALNAMARWPPEDVAKAVDAKRAANWLAVMSEAALAIFDDMAPVQDADAADVKRVIDGRRFLANNLRGLGANGTKMFSVLGLARAEPKSRKGKGKGA